MEDFINELIANGRIVQLEGGVFTVYDFSVKGKLTLTKLKVMGKDHLKILSVTDTLLDIE